MRYAKKQTDDETDAHSQIFDCVAVRCRPVFVKIPNRRVYVSRERDFGEGRPKLLNGTVGRLGFNRGETNKTACAYKFLSGI